MSDLLVPVTGLAEWYIAFGPADREERIKETLVEHGGGEMLIKIDLTTDEHEGVPIERVLLCLGAGERNIRAENIFSTLTTIHLELRGPVWFEGITEASVRDLLEVI